MPNTAAMIVLRLLGGGGGSILPLSINFSALSDGALPAPLTAATWAIVSGAAQNTPGEGANQLTDGGLEATYTGGLCATLTAAGTGTPTLAESADAHSGSKAQAFTATGANQNLKFANVAVAKNVWAQFRGWMKRASGTTLTAQIQASGSGVPVAAPTANVKGATYVQLKTAILQSAAGNVTPVAFLDAAASNWPAVVGDDYEFVILDSSTVYNLLPATVADVTIKFEPVNPFVDDAFFGVIARCSASDFNNWIGLFAKPHATNATFLLFYIVKCVNGTPSTVSTPPGQTIVSGAFAELRLSGTSVSAWYNGSQIGTTQTVSDASITGTRHGLFSTGGNKFKRFFVEAA